VRFVDRRAASGPGQYSAFAGECAVVKPGTTQLLAAGGQGRPTVLETLLPRAV